MKNIIHIFRKDVRGLCRNFFALVIAIGLCFIPSLYAWFNIYSNEDPYANTGNIYIAVASEDEGMKLEDGTTINMGDQVMEQLKENKSIGWQFVDSSDEAISGVESGKYYAAVVIGDRFSESMFSIFSEGLENPTITYYENEKKNAIATKITDTAVSTLKSSINETFLETAASAMFAQMDNLSEKISEDGGVDGFRQNLEQLSQNLKDYDAMIDSFLSGNEELSAGIDEANDSVAKVEDKIDSAVNSLNGTKTQLDSTDTTLSDFSKNVETTLTDIENSLNKISTDITNAGLGDSAKKTTESIETTTDDIKTLNDQLQSLYGAISGLKTDESFTDEQKSDMDDVMSQIDALKQDAEEMQKLLETLMPDNASDAVKDTVDTVTGGMNTALSTCSKTIENMKNVYTNNLVPGVSGILDTASQILVNVTNLLNNLNNTLGDMGTIFDGTLDMVDATDESFTQIQTLLQTCDTKIEEAISKLDEASEDEQMQIIMELLGGDPESYGKFFAQPVKVETKQVYEIKNYGSAVAPFYTTLALWVGGIVLVALIKVKASEKDLTNPKRYQLFFGRYLIFFVMGQIQALIIVLGNIYLLHCQVKNPVLFWFAASLTSFTFTLLIYALTLSFGDIGKALVVVMVVIQIAGSGGTYPIEILPEFYRRVYIFFPFPYAINAMRETIGGMYGGAYEKNLAELLIFAAAALLIGLLIRVPFMGINHFVEKRMKDTKMM